MIIDKNNYKEYLTNNGMRLDCYNKGVTEIKYLPEGLFALDCDYNKLTHLPELPKSLGFINSGENPNLPYAGLYSGNEQINILRNRVNMDLYLEGKI